MTRSVCIATAVLAVLTVSEVHAQTQSESMRKTGKTLGASEMYWTSASQQHEQHSQDAVADHSEAQHEFHRNHFGGFLGASTHFDNDETGFTLGLEYARQFTPHWAAAAYTELVAGESERDIILVAGAIYYPIRRFGLVAGPGVEIVSKDVEHHGTVEREEETEFLFRIGAGYSFPVGQGSLGPIVMADWAGSRWTLAYGIGMVTGF